jgi:hypothetical protein
MYTFWNNWATDSLARVTPRGAKLNTYIAAFLVLGACFGLLSFSHRHLFNEGPTQAAQASGLAFTARLFWLLVCTFLWPIMVLTGINTAWVLAKRKRHAVSK